MKKTKSPERPRIAFYRRISRDDPNREKVSMELQLEKCQQEADHRYGAGLYDCEDFADPDYSGSLGLRSKDSRKTKHRPRFSDLMEGIAEGRFDVVIIYRLDRLFRSASLAMHVLKDYFQEHEVGLVSVQEHIDASSAHGRAMIGVMAVMAEYFLEWGRENIIAALHKIRSEGRRLGKAPYGWRLPTEEEKQAGVEASLMRNEEQGEWVVRIKDWFLSGWGRGTIIQALHEAEVKSPKGLEWWTDSVVKDLLTNRTHCGQMELGDGLIVDIIGVKPYYDVTVYEQILEKMKERAAKGPAGTAAPHYLLPAVLECEHCGGPMRGRRNLQRGHLYYRCVAPPDKRTKDCGRNSKQADLIDRCATQAIEEFAARPDVQELVLAQAMQDLNQGDQDLGKGLKELKRGLAAVKTEQERWTAEFRGSGLDREVYIEEANALQEKKRQLEARVADLQRQLDRRHVRDAQAQMVAERLLSFTANWDPLDLEQRRELAESLLEKVIVGHQEDGDTHVHVIPRLGPTRDFTIPLMHGGDRLIAMKQLAHLELSHRGLDEERIAEAWGVSVQAVRSSASRIRKALGVGTLEEAYEQQKEDVIKYLDWLPLEGEFRRPAGSKVKTCLTDAQTQVLLLKAQGLRGKAIADALGITVGAVYKHLHDIRVQLGVDTDKAAVEKAAQWGLIDLGKPVAVPLTPRERAYLYLRRSGLADADVAAKWEVALSNVLTTRKHVLEKAECLSVEQLLADKPELVPQHAYGLPLGPLENRRREPSELSDKTIEVLRLRDQGVSYQNIAERTGIEFSTVGYHLRRAAKVLGVETPAEAVEEAKRRGLL